MSDEAVLSVAGEVDAETAPGFSGQADALLGAGETGRLVLDLAGVQFMDSSGIEMLTRVRTACAERNVELRLRAVPDRVQRLLRITGTEAGFVFEDSAQEN